jgi:hypothetical protein
VAGRAARGAILVAFVGLTAYATFVVGSYSFYPAREVRQAVAALAILTTVPGWLILALAARARGAPWTWLAFALAWGAFAAVWLALFAFGLVDPVELGRPTVTLEPRVSSIVAAPLIEEPAKLLGAWVALAAARRHGAAISAALGAAIGGLVGIAFGIAEVAHRIAAIVGELGVTNVSGVFEIDWRTVAQITEFEFARRFALAGLTNHALFSALAGAGLALFLTNRRRLALACFVGAIAGHAVTNAFAGQIMATVIDTLLLGIGPLPRAAIPLMLAGWLASLSAMLITEGWAALLVAGVIRRSGARVSTRAAAT